MIKLVAKNQSDGRYYFYKEDDIVYMIKSPLTNAKKEQVDSLPVFLRKSLDTDLTYCEDEFENIEELRTFAIRDCAPEERGIKLSSHETLDDLLVYVPIETVKKYFELIGNMISNKELKGLDILFAQLSKNYELCNSEILTKKMEKLKNDYDRVRFTHIGNKSIIDKIARRIQTDRNVFSFA